MKKCILILAILFSFSAFAKEKAPFQGKITYDLEFSGLNAEFASLFMFTKYEFYFGENAIRLHLSGGISYMMGDFIVNNKSEKSFMLDDIDKIAYDMSSSDEPEEKSSITSIVPTKEKEKILGYKCFKHEVTTVDEDGKSVMTEYWVTKDIKPKANENLDIASTLFINGIEGFPLKIVQEIDGMKIVQTASEVKFEVLDPNLFTIPKNYQVKDISESPLMKMGEENENE